jgi:hypothetical protein
MGLDAEVIAIGRYGVLRELGLLDYNEDAYDMLGPEVPIICSPFYANTDSESLDLAEICCVDPWDLGTHHIQEVCDIHDADNDYNPLIGDKRASDVFILLKTLLDEDVDLWFRPNA